MARVCVLMLVYQFGFQDQVKPTLVIALQATTSSLAACVAWEPSCASCDISWCCYRMPSLERRVDIRVAQKIESDMAAVCPTYCGATFAFGPDACYAQDELHYKNVAAPDVLGDRTGIAGRVLTVGAFV